MTDSEKLQAILDYAKRIFDSATITHEMVATRYYNDDATYTYDMVQETYRISRERSSFYQTIKQIIETPDEYLKERNLIKEYVEKIMNTKG